MLFPIKMPPNSENLVCTEQSTNDSTNCKCLSTDQLSKTFTPLSTRLAIIRLVREYLLQSNRIRNKQFTW